ncbi:MAG TPA: glycosyltransferase [Bacteroidales bacterium]|nr:glycosyltransferase [Bacteroidales bacterium]HPS70886.1 glycosyltransferase [Bacteroidales bacterium]
MKLSIIIVNYNVSHFLRQCLLSVYDAINSIETEIFVVDNNSVDDSVKMVQTEFPGVKLIVNEQNTGFSKANNIAIKESKGEYILLLNPDTLVEKKTFIDCIQYMDENQDVGSLGVKMINGKGEFLPESKRALPIPSVAFYKIFGLSKLFPNSKKFGSYHLTYLDHDQIHEVEVLSGAYMMLRKTVLDQIGYLDEDFFMYGEDVDLSYRVTKAGYKNIYFPKARIIHYKGESTKKGSINYVLVFYRAMQIFVKKHFAQKNIFLFNIVITFAIWFRASMAIIKRIYLQLLLPFLDFAVVYAGMLLLAKYWEEKVLISPYPDIYRYLFIPLYIILWILSIAITKGYKKPFSLQKTNRGILIGTIGILIFYSLLPETSRYSRAIIVLGAMWTTIAMNSIRYLLHKLKIKQFYFGSDTTRKILIIGDLEETQRVTFLTQLNDKKPEIIDSLCDFNISEASLLKKIKQQKYTEIVFCTKSIEIKKVIDIIYNLKYQNLEFKTAPADSNVLISSQEIRIPVSSKPLDTLE